MLITENVHLHKLNTKCQEILSKYKICPEGPECPELDQIVCHRNPGYFNSVNMIRNMIHRVIDKDL